MKVTDKISNIMAKHYDPLSSYTSMIASLTSAHTLHPHHSNSAIPQSSLSYPLSPHSILLSVHCTARTPPPIPITHPSSIHVSPPPPLRLPSLQSSLQLLLFSHLTPVKVARHWQVSGATQVPPFSQGLVHTAVINAVGGGGRGHNQDQS